MYSRKEQYELLQQIRCKENETKRIDCPFCNGKKTLTVSNREGSIVWNCYKASCSARGGKRVGYSLGSIKDRVSNGRPDKRTNIVRTPLPEIHGNPDNHERVIKYLEDNHSYLAFRDGAIKITYDPTKDRVLFWMNENLGAVGRTLRNGIKPKWLSYGDTSGILKVGCTDIGVIVEDAASACSVYTTGIYTGIALLGTNLSAIQKSQLKHYKKLIICLDKDASSKALVLAKRLSGFAPTTVRLLDEDLKYLDQTSILEVINESQRTSNN